MLASFSSSQHSSFLLQILLMSGTLTTCGLLKAQRCTSTWYSKRSLDSIGWNYTLLLFSFPSTTTTPRPTGHCAAVESDYILPLLRNGVESPTVVLLRVRPCIHPDATFSDERRTCDVACNVMIYYMFNVFNVGRLLEYTRSCCCCPCCHKAN